MPETIAAGPTADQALDDSTLQAILTDFHRDGFRMIRSILAPSECANLRQAIDDVFADPSSVDSHHLYGDIVAVRLFERSNLFRDLLVREPIIGIVEAVLGASCHLIAQNAVRNPPGKAIDAWHVDDGVEFPVAGDMPRHDSRLIMPVQRLTVQVLLTDVPDEEHGPSQYIPGSHYAGRHPDPKAQPPTFESKGPVSLTGQAGDIYLHNGQTWHRGSPNRSSRTRYLLQFAFGRRYIAQRFFPFIHYRLPPHVLEGASDRLRRVLGEHPKGPYG